MAQFLAISWSVSRGQDTYGYNICRLDTPAGRFRTCGGGYDMTSTVLGKFLAEAYQSRLVSLADRAHYKYDGRLVVSERADSIYGMMFDTERNRVSIDGACGTAGDIAAMIGVSLEPVYSPRGKLVGYLMSDKGE